MSKIGDVIKIIEEFAPLENQAHYDNCGLLYGDPSWELKGALVTLDTSVSVVNEAISKGANLIIEHHPSIFMPIKKIDLSYPKHKAIALAIKNDIAIYSAHTSIDFAVGGLNDRVMELLGCKEYYIPSDRLDDMRIGVLEVGCKLSTLVERVGKIFNDKHVAFVGDADNEIKTIAVINGGGGSQEGTLLEAIRCKADVFISGDFKYNVLRLAKDLGYNVIVFGHYDSETPFMDLVKNKLIDNNIQNVHGATSCTNPLN